MKSSLVRAGQWLQRRAEDVAAALLMVMFLAFIIQIVFRYVFNWPLSWTFELSIVCWLWGVLWGAAFIVRERDEIRFDVILGLVSGNARRIFTIVTGVATVAIFTLSLPAVVDYVTFMKVERSAYLKVPFDVLFSVYVLFAVATIVRYVWLTWRAVRGDAASSLIDPDRTGPAP
jgi:C4-dicarboxylate transporter, DctQ subunit